MSDQKATSPISFDVGARAEAKLEIKAEVPASSTGRFVDAITDLFRPISEARGLKADLIRLQREEVAIKIAKLAREISDVRGETIVAPPLKILIPLFEKASQEDFDDEFMLDAWAKLLVSASSPNSISPRLISLIGEMSSRQARLFLDVMERGKPGSFDELNLYDAQRHFMEEKIDGLWSKETVTARQIFDQILPNIEIAGAALDDIAVSDDDGMHSVSVDGALFGDADSAVDLEVLASLGLFTRVDIWRTSEVRRVSQINVRYFLVSRLGIMFYEAVTIKTKKRSPDEAARNPG